MSSGETSFPRAQCGEQKFWGQHEKTREEKPERSAL